MITYWYKSKKNESELHLTELQLKISKLNDKRIRNLSADDAYEQCGQYLQRLTSDEVITHKCGKFYSEIYDEKYVKMMLKNCNYHGEESKLIEVIYD